MLPPPSDQSLALISRVARHEIAHHVAATAMGFSTTKVTVKFSATGHHGQSHINLHEACSTLDEIVQYARRRMIVLMAGSIAEALSESEVRIDLNEAGRVFQGPNTGTDADKACTHEWMQLIHNIIRPENQARGDVLNTLWNQATAVIYLNADVIVKLSKALMATITKHADHYSLELTTTQINCILNGSSIPRLDNSLETICEMATSRLGTYYPSNG